jgi:hypothetical protein
MKAIVSGLSFHPDPRTLPATPEDFSFYLEVRVGAAPKGGGEAFGVTVCSPEWLAKKCETEGYFPGFHHLVVPFEDYDERKLRDFIDTWVSRCEGSDWEAIAQRLRMFGQWEYEDYKS